MVAALTHAPCIGESSAADQHASAKSNDTWRCATVGQISQIRPVWHLKSQAWRPNSWTKEPCSLHPEFSRVERMEGACVLCPGGQCGCAPTACISCMDMGQGPSIMDAATTNHFLIPTCLDFPTARRSRVCTAGDGIGLDCERRWGECHGPFPLPLLTLHVRSTT